MSGICSAHQGHDLACAQCMAIRLTDKDEAYYRGWDAALAAARRNNPGLFDGSTLRALAEADAKADILEAANRVLADELRRTEDDPDTDCTDFAHPAWRRGEESGVRAVVRALSEMLDRGEHVGRFADDGLDALAKRIVGLTMEAKR